VVGARGEVQLLHGGLEEPLAGGVGLAEVAHFGGAHLSVAGRFGSSETLELALSRCLHACADGDRGFGVAFIGQLLVVDAGNFDVDVDAVQQRAADALLVTHDGGGGTAAFSDRVAEEATGIGMRLVVTRQDGMDVKIDFLSAPS
jgi:hypothetical protein